MHAIKQCGIEPVSMKVCAVNVAPYAHRPLLYMPQINDIVFVMLIPPMKGFTEKACSILYNAFLKCAAEGKITPK